MDIEERGIKMNLELSEEIYSLEALKIAKNIVDKDGLISLAKKGKTIRINFKSYEERILKEFLNEALAQQCRIDTLKMNGKVAKMITTIAIVSSLPTQSIEENKS